MNLTKNVRLFIGIIFIVLALACTKDKTEDPVEIPFSLSEIEDIATFRGNLEGDVVVVKTQGGPDTELYDEDLTDFINQAQAQNALFVNVHQAQTLDPSKFEDDITFEDAKQYDRLSVDYLKRVLDFFAQYSNKTVYVLGISFGAFMAQELIATHEVDLAAGYLIMVGRLDIEEEFWKNFSRGEYSEFSFDEDGNPSIDFYGAGEDAFSRNMARLAAGLGYNRYTQRLDYLNDLSKITYVYGERDDAVGRLSKEEVNFLNKKNARVIPVSGADQSDAIDEGIGLMKELFNIP